MMERCGCQVRVDPEVPKLCGVSNLVWLRIAVSTDTKIRDLFKIQDFFSSPFKKVIA